MNRRRGGVAAVAYNNYIYAFGGYDLPVSNPACQRINSIERYVNGLKTKRHFNLIVTLKFSIQIEV